MRNYFYGQSEKACRGEGEKTSRSQDDKTCWSSWEKATRRAKDRNESPQEGATIPM
jgi:hypothetical protein